LVKGLLKIILINMKKSLTILLLLLLPLALEAETSIPFTLDDRDRLIRVEQRMDALEKTMDAKFDSLQGQINDIKTLMYFVLGGMLGLMGFILWDRRTFLKPFETRAGDLEATDRKIINVLREEEPRTKSQVSR
jgi:hypothetical protein